jgi:hypothetical protein
MPEPVTDPVERTPDDEILTLSEAAAFLRVKEVPLAELASCGAVPAQQIGTEWRFLKQALVRWLLLGSYYPDLIRFVPYPFLGDHVSEKWISLLEQRLLSRIEGARPTSPKRGSKQAVQKSLGVFKGDSDAEVVLAALSAMREAGADEGGE